MEFRDIFQAKHELWLMILFGSFAVQDQEIKNELYEMAQMEFRHLKWIANELANKELEYSYNKGPIDMQKGSHHQLYAFLIDQIQLVMKHYDPSNTLFGRILSDEYFFITRLQRILNTTDDTPLTAYDKKRIYPNKNLSKESLDALTLFLFEETYKEYELILVYAYMQNYTKNITHYNVYQDLIDESQYHLKSFGNLLSKLGILAIPRTVIEAIYKRIDVKAFLIDGIEEEKKAKEECAKLSMAVKDDELSKFFEFINYQETYHIELMKKAIVSLENA